MFVFRSTYLAKVKECKDLQDYCSRLTTEVNEQNQIIREMAEPNRINKILPRELLTIYAPKKDTNP